MRMFGSQACRNAGGRLHACCFTEAGQKRPKHIHIPTRKTSRLLRADSGGPRRGESGQGEPNV